MTTVFIDKHHETGRQILLPLPAAPQAARIKRPGILYDKDDVSTGYPVGETSGKMYCIPAEHYGINICFS
jgi:hypothetical protein